MFNPLILRIMTTQNSNLAIVNANEVSKSATNNASEPKGLAYVMSHLSELAGRKVDDLCAAYRKSFLDRVKKHTQFNGRMIDLRADVKDTTERQLLNSIEFKVAAKSHLAHIEVCELADGEVVKCHILLVKQVSVEANGDDLVHGKTKVTRLDDEVIKTYLKLSKDTKIALTGYRHSVGDEFVPCTNYSDLLHEVATDVDCMQEYTAEDGTKGKCPIFIKNEDGKAVKKTEVKNVSFYPVLDETVSPKTFINAVNKAMADMWIMLFPSKEGNEQPAQTEEAAK